MVDWSTEFNNIIHSPKPENFNFKPTCKNIVLYGAGSLGRLALNLLKSNSIMPSYFLDKHIKGKVDGLDIKNPDEIKDEEKKEIVVIICIVTLPIEPIFKDLKELGYANICHFYDFTEIFLKDRFSNGWFSPFLNDDEINSINQIFKSIEHDQCSVAHYLQFLWWRLRRKEVEYTDYPVLSGRKYFLSPIFPPLSSNESLVDGGAHIGETISSFIKITKGAFDKIWVFEPDELNLSILKTFIAKNQLDNVIIFPIALSDKNELLRFSDGLGYASNVNKMGKRAVKAVCLDSMVEIEPTILKLHLEGYELMALRGAVKKIEKHRPIIMVLADHNRDGLYLIPQFLSNLKDYKLFFNLHDYCGNSAVFYAIPAERSIK